MIHFHCRRIATTKAAPSRVPFLTALTIVICGMSSAWSADDPQAPHLTLANVAAGHATILDLSYPLNASTNFWPGEKYHPFQLETIATLEQDGVLSRKMSLPEHIGTHLDAPNHFEPDQPDVAQIPPQQLFAEGVMIDISTRAEADHDTILTLPDIHAWEQAHGRIPQRSIVLLCTGWGRYWSQPERFQGRDVQGKLHFPGYSREAVELLIRERDIKGIGIDTLSIDPGISRTFEAHHVCNRAGRFGLENVAQLERLPPRGFYLVLAPIKVETGTGGPCRIFAILPAGKS